MQFCVENTNIKSEAHSGSENILHYNWTKLDHMGMALMKRHSLLQRKLAIEALNIGVNYQQNKT